MRHVRIRVAAMAALFVMAMPAAAEAPMEIKGSTTVNAEQIIELRPRRPI